MWVCANKYNTIQLLKIIRLSRTATDIISKFNVNRKADAGCGRAFLSLSLVVWCHSYTNSAIPSLEYAYIAICMPATVTQRDVIVYAYGVIFIFSLPILLSEPCSSSTAGMFCLCLPNTWHR